MTRRRATSSCQCVFSCFRMHLSRLRLTDFRCFEALEIEPGPGINVVSGDNASGKTSLLEAIYILGRGQSFRHATARPAVRDGETAFTVHGVVKSTEQRTRRVAVQRDRRGMHYRCDTESATTRLDLVNALPLQLIDPNLHRLLEQGPRYRRHFLDWGVFHVEHAFFPAWHRYRRALRQRNRALKARWAKKDVIAWDAELVHNAEIVDACRRAYIDDIRRHMPAQAERLLGEATISIEYHPGWRQDESFGAALAAGLDQDQRLGFTQRGPHRADLQISVAETAARDWVSRGQQKVLTAALLVVQARLLYLRRGVQPLLLVDDLAAELGPQYRAGLATEIAALGGQCFLTFLEPELVPEALSPRRMFHVEHGRVTVVNDGAC